MWLRVFFFHFSGSRVPLALLSKHTTLAQNGVQHITFYISGCHHKHYKSFAWTVWWPLDLAICVKVQKSHTFPMNTIWLGWIYLLYDLFWFLHQLTTFDFYLQKRDSNEMTFWIFGSRRTIFTNEEKRKRYEKCHKIAWFVIAMS